MSEFFHWDQSFDVGSRDMNAEHMQLIQLMNALHEQHEAKAGREVLKRSIEQLRDFTIKHFQAEEAMMERLQYPKIDSHKIIHSELLRKFQIHYDEFKAQGSLRQEFFDFLQLWLSAHIRGIDMQYSPYQKQAG